MSHRNRAEKRTAGAPAKRRRRGVVIVLSTVAAFALAGASFWAAGGGSASHAYAMAPESVLPPQVRQAPPRVREAYRFAVANRDTLRWFPCFCGCGHDGHSSNADCYVKDIGRDGSVVFDYMSLG